MQLLGRVLAFVLVSCIIVVTVFGTYAAVKALIG